MNATSPRWSFILAFASIVVLAPPAFAQAAAQAEVDARQKVSLRQHWEPGKVYHYELQLNWETIVPGLPGDGVQATNAILQLEMAVRKEPGSDRKLVTVRLPHMKAVLTSAGQLATYDSDDKEGPETDPTLYATLGILKGGRVVLVYDKDDQYVDFIIPDDLPESGAEPEHVAKSIREYALIDLPLQPVALHEPFSLERTTDVDPIGVHTYKIKGQIHSITPQDGRRLAKVLEEGTVESPKTRDDDPAFYSIVPGAKLTSESIFDLDRKVVTHVTASSEFKLSVNGGNNLSVKQRAVTILKSIKPIE